MASYRLRCAALCLLTIATSQILVGAAHAQPRTRNVLVVALPASEAQAFFQTHPSTIALGVYPESRDPLAFVREIGFGSPSATDISTRDTKPPRLADALSKAGVTVIFSSASDRGERIDTIEAALFPAFVPRSPAAAGGEGRVTVKVLQRTQELESEKSFSHMIVLGLGDRTPVIAGLCASECLPGEPSSTLLKGGITRRPGLITPYDLGATILGLSGVSTPNDFIGRRLGAEPRSDALAHLDRLRKRLARDASSGSTAAVVTDAMTVTVLVFGILLVWVGRKRIAAGGAQGGWMAVALGYPVSRFLTTGNGTLRALPVAVAFVLGAGLSPQRMTRNARIFFGIALATAVMFALATLNPGGEPGLSIWGNPLTSWRFFGMQNAWAATIAGGVVVWGVLAGLGTAALVAVTAAVAVLMGAPTIGANFVGVLTFAFGAALAALALWRQKVKPVHVVVASAAALVAFFLALLADAGSPVSHGGRAAKSISEGGISTAWDYVTGRIRLNIDLIRGFWGGPIWVVLFLTTLVALALWGSKANEGPLRARAAVWGGAMMALASFVLEDSGFYSGTTLLGAALAGWIVTQAAVSSPVTDSSDGG